MVDQTGLPSRKSMRLKDYDYSRPGAYFVTLCVKDHHLLFGTVQNGNIELSPPGLKVHEIWSRLPEHFPYIALDDFVVMPNHLHAIIVINADPEILSRIGDKLKPLGRILGAFKAETTREINRQRKLPGTSIWQRSFWDRIIRNNDELNRVREYILYNPSRWEIDKLNPGADLQMNESITNHKDIEWQG